MAMRCMNCDKGIMFGHNVSHAKNRTAKQFKPNLHSARVMIGNHMKKMKLCTKCLRLVKKSSAQAAEKKVTSQTTPPVVA